MTKIIQAVTHYIIFRQFLIQPDIARNFIDIHLPKELRVLCNFSMLKLESDYLHRISKMPSNNGVDAVV
ncbi:Rpn family recombination-promoting nuclease/putative transposase, partial [Serratia marcescens]|uniref:Rpn family recombination-promoting nuclease/putative transposase n=1 Tax=Serratia marcescens TaxID=615 RepID=UPI003C6EF387